MRALPSLWAMLGSQEVFSASCHLDMWPSSFVTTQPAVHTPTSPQVTFREHDTGDLGEERQAPALRPGLVPRTQRAPPLEAAPTPGPLPAVCGHVACGLSVPCVRSCTSWVTPAGLTVPQAQAGVHRAAADHTGDPSTGTRARVPTGRSCGGRKPSSLPNLPASL